jgi:hypothetical protein
MTRPAATQPAVTDSGRRIERRLFRKKDSFQKFSVADPECLSRIQKQQQKKGLKKNLLSFL